MIKVSCTILVALFCIISCAPVQTKKPTVEVGSTVKEAMAIAQQKAKARQYDYIIDHMLAQELVDKMIGKYGAEHWKKKFQEDRLSSLRYYFGWLKKHRVRTSGDKIIVMGQHGCYAVFVKVKGKCLILDFGQRIKSM